MTPTEQDKSIGGSMTAASRELFELCKQAYEATGWKYTIGKFHDDGSYDGYVGHRGIAYTPNPQNAEWLPKNIPLYTSDYLLEKLQKVVIANERYIGIFVTEYDYVAQETLCDDEGAEREIRNYHGDTPLKALLKLTIALLEAGELK